jgi:hypothetical protein
MSTLSSSSSTPDLASALAALQDGCDEDDKRLSPRAGVRLRAQVVFPKSDNGDAGQVNVLLQNVSSRGVGLMFAHRPAPRARFLLLLPTRSQGTIAMPCELIHTRPAGNGFYHLGARFSSDPYLLNAPDPVSSDAPPPSEQEVKLLRLVLGGRYE